MSKSTVAKNAAAIAVIREEMAELKSNFEKNMDELKSRLDELLLREEENLQPPVPPVLIPEIEDHDVLLIGDSIISAADPEVIDPDSDITIECIRGGRPADISDKFEEISKKKRFKRIIVHVGSNLAPRFSPDYVADQVLLCLERIKTLSPNSDVTFSCILPKTSNALLPGISYVNHRVAQSGKFGPARHRFNSLRHSSNFSDEHGHVIPSHFNSDGIHLSLDGALAFNLGLNFFIGKN